jgi:staphyloferrin B synthase
LPSGRSRPNDTPHERVLKDLFDCLCAEGFFDSAEQEWEGDTWRWWLSRTPEHYVRVPVARGIVQQMQKIRGAPAHVVKEGIETPLDAMGFMELVAARVDNKEGVAWFMRWLETSVQQTAWSALHHIDEQGPLSFRVLEQCASLTDRPFHPVAKTKMGFGEADYKRYLAEFGHAVSLSWVAVKRNLLECGSGVTNPLEIQPAHDLLTIEQQAALSRKTPRDHVALPVHPWQLQHILPKHLPGAYVPLPFQGGDFWPTSSLRSLAPRAESSPHHLKLPLSVYSLGASRYLPAVKMINGQRSEALLRQAIQLDPVLAQRVFVCDETKWWAYMPESGSLFDEAPRHLSAMVRSYPRAPMQDKSYRLVPMAALGTLLPSGRHFFDEWLRHRQLPGDRASVLMLFEELCTLFFEINLRMFRLGLLAEVHGQNAVLVLRNAYVSGLLLRDHDSLRIHVPWLSHNGLADPQYRLKAGHPNTLYHDTPEGLLFYLQTLGIQVNARAIIEALALRYDIAEAKLWSVLHWVLMQAIERVPFSESARSLLHQRLFQEERWPLKLLIKPMIERAGGPGSMPFGKGTTVNPFRHASR